jgi:hypothetical protein
MIVDSGGFHRNPRIHQNPPESTGFCKIPMDSLLIDLFHQIPLDSSWTKGFHWILLGCVWNCEVQVNVSSHPCSQPNTNDLLWIPSTQSAVLNMILHVWLQCHRKLQTGNWRWVAHCTSVGDGVHSMGYHESTTGDLRQSMGKILAWHTFSGHIWMYHVLTGSVEISSISSVFQCI